MKHWIMNRVGLAVLLALVVNTAYAQFSKEEVKQSAWEEYFTGKLINVALWPDGMPNDNGIDYANLPESSWDMMPQLEVSLPPKGDKPTRAVVICPGGGYVTLARYHEGNMWGKFFQQQNVATVTLIYRMLHQHHEVPLSDAYQAMRLVKAHSKEWNIDADQIGIMGSSAGGHLASTVATHAPDSLRPAFQILFYPVITMDKLYTHGYSKKMLIGENPTQEMETLYSNEKQVDGKTPRAFIVLADDDDTVSPLNAVLYYTALKQHKVPVNLHIYPTGGHGFGISPKWKYHASMMNELADWLRSF